MNKLIISAAALVCAAQAFALVEKTEKMTVVKTDGTKVEFNVADVDNVTFEEIEVNYPFYIAPAGAEAVKLTAFPTVFRQTPAVDGDPYVFGFPVIAAETPADARQGDYAVEVTIGATVMNTSNVDLASGGNSGVIVKLYKYEDGKVKKEWEEQTSGNLTTAVNNKTQQVTFELEAAYKDGTEIAISFQGKVTATTEIAALNPPFEYVNQGQYFNADGKPQGLFDITSAKLSTGQSYRGISNAHYFELTCSNGNKAKIYVKADKIGQEINFAESSGLEFIFMYDNIQIYGKGAGMMEGTEGWIKVIKNEDGSYVVDADVTNRYMAWGSVSGTPERVRINYTGTPN